MFQLAFLSVVTLTPRVDELPMLPLILSIASNVRICSPKLVACLLLHIDTIPIQLNETPSEEHLLACHRYLCGEPHVFLCILKYHHTRYVNMKTEFTHTCP